MKTYLTDFFKLFDYPQEAQNAFFHTYQAIQVNSSARIRWSALIDEYIANFNCDLKAQLNVCSELAKELRISEFNIQLLLFICHSKQLRVIFHENEIDDDIWFDTVAELKAKLFECHELYGIWGSFVASCFKPTFQLNGFVLGRLRFDPHPFGKTYEKNGICLNEESIVITTHIPRTGEPLSPDACDKAFQRAIELFSSRLNLNPCVFTCSSWLLFPEHEKMLPATSNIVAFSKRFELLGGGIHLDSSPNLWRIFDTLEQNPDRLPTDTSLRRAYVDYLRRGEKLGWGYGIYIPSF